MQDIFLEKMVACAVGMTFERNMRFVEMSWDFWDGVGSSCHYISGLT